MKKFNYERRNNVKKIYIVTGANGHLGFNLIKKLLDKNVVIRAFDLNFRANFIKSKNLTIYKGDICNPKDIEKLFKDTNGASLYIVHCAGIVSIASRYNQKVYDVNVNGTKNIVDISFKKKVEKFLYVSSVHAIPEKENDDIITEVSNFKEDHVVGLYAKTKATATQYVLDTIKKGLNAIIVHPSGIIGPYDYYIGHTTRLIVDYINGRLTSGIKGGHDFVDVRDVCDGIISALEKGKIGECYLLTNRYISVKELLDTLQKITNQRKIRNYLPLWFIKPMAGIAELYYKILKTKPLFTTYSIYTLQTNSTFSHQKATEELGYMPRELSITLKDTYTWLKEEKIVKDY